MTTDTYFTTGSVATQLGVPRWKLSYLIERGAVPGPSLNVPGRRLFSGDDVERIRRALPGIESCPEPGCRIADADGGPDLGPGCSRPLGSITNARSAPGGLS
jgi:hypothetical protein